MQDCAFTFLLLFLHPSGENDDVEFQMRRVTGKKNRKCAQQRCLQALRCFMKYQFAKWSYIMLPRIYIKNLNYPVRRCPSDLKCHRIEIYKREFLFFILKNNKNSKKNCQYSILCTKHTREIVSWTVRGKKKTWNFVVKNCRYQFFRAPLYARVLKESGKETGGEEGR